MIETLPPAGYAADVPRPSIGFSIDVPDHWTVLDLNPQTWEDWLYAFLSQRLAGRPNASAERGPARRALLDLLRQLHDQKVFMAAILPAVVRGELLSASATLAWRKLDLGGEGIPLAGLREAYARAPASSGENLSERRVETVEIGLGGAVKVSTREIMQLPMIAEARRVAVTQYFVPVLDTEWLSVITTTTGDRALESGVEEVADTMAASLTFSRNATPRR
ncbi:MAG: hypothetical protein ACRD0K_13635 [Egibacteraceae bacterium]